MTDVSERACFVVDVDFEFVSVSKCFSTENFLLCIFLELSLQTDRDTQNANHMFDQFI